MRLPGGSGWTTKPRTNMSTVERIEQLVGIAQQLGYRVRYDYFGGTGGGACQVAGGKWLFIDLALTSGEQLEMLQKLLSHEPLLFTAASPEIIADMQRAA